MARAYSHGGDTTARVYVFDAVDDWRWPQEAMQQLRMAHRFRNALVEAEREHQQARANIWASIPEVAAAQTAAAEARSKLGEAIAAVKEANQRLGYAKHRREDTTAAQAELAAAEQHRRDVAAASRQAAEAVKAAEKRHKKQVNDQLTAAGKVRDQKVIDLRKQFIADGLFWSTAGDVFDKHRVRVGQVLSLRAQGRPADLRFRRWDGSGSITMILQRQQDKPQRTPELIADGEASPWRTQMWLRPWMPPEDYEQLKRSEQRRFYKSGRVRMRVRASNTAEGAAWVDVPVYISRMIPADADIVSAQLVREVVGTRTQTRLCVTARIPAPTQKPEGGPVVAVHTGWRTRPDGSLRVAVWRSDTPLQVPAHLADVLPEAGTTATTGEVIIPAGWRGYARKTDDVASIRDKHRDAIRDTLVAWFAERGPITAPWTGRDGEPVELTTAVVERWRSSDRFARLANAWATEPPPDSEEILTALAEWTERDRHLWHWHAGGSRRLGQIRRDRWRRVAAWLTQQAGTVIVDDTDLARVAKKKQGDEDGMEAARRNRVLAAPGELRQAIRLAADSRGVQQQQASADGITVTHHTCGHRNDRSSEHAADVMVRCAGCGADYDQDHNAVAWLLASARGESPPKPRKSVRSKN